MRVFNDDIVEPGQGFGMHPHRDMEIVTYVLAGELEHQDSTGNRGVIHPGEVQVMSAGSGIRHSEYNHSKKKPVHFMQIWIFPRKKGSKPRWEQHQFTPSERTGKLLPIVSGGELAGTLTIDQDAQIYVSALPAGSDGGTPDQAPSQDVSFRDRGGSCGERCKASGRRSGTHR